MERIYPLNEEVISRYRGMLVCVVFNNGVRQIGVLEACAKGTLELNTNPFGYGSSPVASYPEAQARPSAEASQPSPARNRRARKAKAASALKKSPSPTNYEVHPDNPAIANAPSQARYTTGIRLDDIALLVLLT